MALPQSALSELLEAFRAGLDVRRRRVTRDKAVRDRGSKDTTDDREASVDRRRASVAINFFTQASTCERRIVRNGWSRNGTPAVAKSAF